MEGKLLQTVASLRTRLQCVLIVCNPFLARCSKARFFEWLRFVCGTNSACLALGLINASAPLTDRLALGAVGIDSLSPGVGLLDLSEDLCAEPLADPCNACEARAFTISRFYWLEEKA